MLAVLVLCHAVAGFSQEPDARACAGGRSIFAVEGSMDGSMYEYIFEEPSAGAITIVHPDTVMVEWSGAKGVYRLGVRETSQYGCIGDWVYLSVELVGASAVFSEPQYYLCGSEGVTVDFNREAFRSYHWVDPEVRASDGRIQHPGRYELQTVDHDDCLVSNYIDVVQAPVLTVSLGADTVMCTPSFTLTAHGAATNPSDTYYTWSTGDNGVMFHEITVYDHDRDADKMYWVRAELHGCSASDTIMVLACIEPPPHMFIPNTITPNDDGDNDVWNIHSLEEYPDCIVEVYDRWGRRVFRSARGYPTPWDGRDARGRDLPVEAYYYVIQLNDGSTPVHGTITIIR